MRFNFLKRGGYDPVQVEAHIQHLNEQIASLKRQSVLSASQSSSPQLYDPDGAVVKVLAAAQAAADRLVNEAQDMARQKIEAYHQENRDKLEAQKLLYDTKRREFAAKLEDVEAMKAELEREVGEFVEQAKFKMTVIAQVARELEGLTNNAEFSNKESMEDITASVNGGVNVNGGASGEKTLNQRKHEAMESFFATQPTSKVPTTTEMPTVAKRMDKPIAEPKASPIQQRVTTPVKERPKTKAPKQWPTADPKPEPELEEYIEKEEVAADVPLLVSQDAELTQIFDPLLTP